MNILGQHGPSDVDENAVPAQELFAGYGTETYDDVSESATVYVSGTGSFSCFESKHNTRARFHLRLAGVARDVSRAQCAQGRGVLEVVAGCLSPDSTAAELGLALRVMEWLAAGSGGAMAELSAGCIASTGYEPSVLVVEHGTAVTWDWTASHTPQNIRQVCL